MEQTEKTSPDKGVLQKSITSGTWLAIGYMFQRSIGTISFILLARILSPEDFGIVAIVLIVPSFIQATTELGFYPAIIQREGEFKKYLNPIWTIGLVKSTIILLITFIFGPLIATFLHAEHATTAIRIGGIFSFILRLGNPEEVITYRKVEFKNIFVRDTIRELVYIIVAVVSAFAFKSYWALLLAAFAAKITQVIVTYVQYSYRPKLSWNWKPLRELIGYSKWIVGQGWLTQTYGLIENFVVARVTNTYSMGLYTKAKSLGSVGPGFISSIMNAVSFSAYSRIKDSTEKINEGFKKSLDVLFFFIMPLGTLLIVAGGKLILIFLGETWLPMTNTMRILFFFFSVNLILEILYSLFNGIGHPQKRVKMDMVKITLTVVLLLIFTLHFGIVGTASALLVGVLPPLFLALTHLRGLTKVKYTTILQTAIIPLFFSGLLLLPFLVWKNELLALPNLLLLTIGFASGIFYLAGVCVVGRQFNYGPYTTLKTIVKYARQRS